MSAVQIREPRRSPRPRFLLECAATAPKSSHRGAPVPAREARSPRVTAVSRSASSSALTSACAVCTSTPSCRRSRDTSRRPSATRARGRAARRFSRSRRADGLGVARLWRCPLTDGGRVGVEEGYWESVVLALWSLMWMRQRERGHRERDQSARRTRAIQIGRITLRVQPSRMRHSSLAFERHGSSATSVSLSM